MAGSELHALCPETPAPVTPTTCLHHLAVPFLTSPKSETQGQALPGVAESGHTAVQGWGVRGEGRICFQLIGNGALEIRAVPVWSSPETRKKGWFRV